MKTVPNSGATLEDVKLFRAQMVLFVQEITKHGGVIPNGHLYAYLMGHMDLRRYQLILSEYKRQGWVREAHNLLRWTGPDVTFIEEGAARADKADELALAATQQ